MRFKDFDTKMRTFEQSLDQHIIPEMYIVVRLDGRGFTKLTKEICDFEKPFDVRFRDLMTETVKHLMNCGFKIAYGYTQSDEISLLLEPDDNTFNHKVRKINSVLAGEASGFFSVKLGKPVCFDCRVIPLPNLELVKDYFAWRQEDASRNCLNGWCYWTLRKENFSKGKATSLLKCATLEQKKKLLFDYKINYDEIPQWQKLGIGMYLQDSQHKGYNPVTKQEVSVIRKRLTENYELNQGDEYKNLIEHIIRFS